MKSVETINLSYTYYDGTRALTNMNFSVEEGENMAILGPNGAGKSTLLHHFNGLLMPSSGKVLVLGKNVDSSNLDWVRQKVGLVFQDPDDQLFARTVGEENRDPDEDAAEERKRTDPDRHTVRCKTWRLDTLVGDGALGHEAPCHHRQPRSLVQCDLCTGVLSGRGSQRFLQSLEIGSQNGAGILSELLAGRHDVGADVAARVARV